MSFDTSLSGGNRIAVAGLSGGSRADIASMSQIIFNKNETVNITGDILLNNLEYELANFKRDSEFLAFKAAALRNIVVTAIDKVYEDGSQDSGTAIPSTAVKLLVVDVDGEISSDGKRRLTAFPALWNPDGYTSSRAANTPTAENVKLKAIAATETTTIAATWVNSLYSDIIDSITDIVLTTGSYGFQADIVVA